jgi:hypothetical protein
MTPTQHPTRKSFFPSTIKQLKSNSPDEHGLYQLFCPDATFRFNSQSALNGGAAGRVIKRQ